MRTMSTTSRRPYGGSMRLPKTRPSVAEESEEDDKSDETSSTDEEADETRFFLKYFLSKLLRFFQF